MAAILLMSFSRREQLYQRFLTHRNGAESERRVSLCLVVPLLLSLTFCGIWVWLWLLYVPPQIQVTLPAAEIVEAAETKTTNGTNKRVGLGIRKNGKTGKKGSTGKGGSKGKKTTVREARPARRRNRRHRPGRRSRPQQRQQPMSLPVSARASFRPRRIAWTLAPLLKNSPRHPLPITGRRSCTEASPNRFPW